MSTILALDIGTEFVKAIVAETVKNDNIKILGVGKSKQADGNMYAGAIADIPAVITVCEKALAEAEDEAKVKASTVIVGIAGELVKGNTTNVRYRRKSPKKPITESEMNEIIKKVQEKSGEVAKKTIELETGNKNVEISLINSAIVSLTIDGYKISNPVGFKGADMMIQFYTAFAPLIHISAIEKVCAELNLDLLTVAVEPFAVCRACLGEDTDSDFSGIVMDIGGGTTDIAIIEDGGVEGTKMFSIGGKSFTHQISQSLGVDFDTADQYKLAFDDGDMDDAIKARVETALSRNTAVWLTGVEVALEDFSSLNNFPRNILLCGGGASLSIIQEELAVSDWYKNLPFSRRPSINLINTDTLPNFILKKHSLDHSFVTALGLLRVGSDTLASTPEENKIKAKISRLLQN